MATLATLESSSSSVRLKTLLAKAKCGSTSVPVDENGAVTNKKQVVGQICDCSLADTQETQRTCFITNHPKEHSEVAPKKAIEKAPHIICAINNVSHCL